MTANTYSKALGITFAVVVATGGAVWGLSKSDDSSSGVKVPKEFTVESLKANVGNMDAMRKTMRSARDRDDLTDEQRQQMRKNMGEVFRSEMNKRVDEYFNASEDQKKEVLDRHIDEWQKMQKEWEKERQRRQAEREREGDGDQADRGNGADGDRRGEGRRGGWRNRIANMTQQQRKEWSESRSPDERARHFQYFMAIRARMAERGIETPQWGPGGGRGRGGRGSGGRG